MFDDSTTYVLLKAIHIASLIFWLGPTLGAWWLLRTASYRFGEPSMISQFLYQMFLRITGIEHIALITLLVSGSLMAIITGSFTQDWFIVKLFLIILIVLPLEVIDIWYCHYKLPALFHERHPSRPYATDEKLLLHNYHSRFVPLALVCIPLTVMSIFWLVIGKPFL